MQNYIDVLVEELKKGRDPLTVLAAFVAAWSTVDSSNILSAQIRRRLGLTYMGDIRQAISTLISRISSDPAFGKRAVDILALAIERDWVRNALKEAAWKGVAQQLKKAAEALYNTHRSYSTKIFLEDISKIIESQQVRSMFDYGAPQQAYGYPPQTQQKQVQPQYSQYAQPPYSYPQATQPAYPPQQAQKPVQQTQITQQVKAPIPPPSQRTPPQPSQQFSQPSPSTVQPQPSETKTVEKEALKPGISAEDLKLFKEEISRYLDTLQVRFSQVSDEIKKMRADMSPLLELNKAIQNVSEQLQGLASHIEQLSSKYDELKNLVDVINAQFSKSLEDLRSRIESLSKEIETMKGSIPKEIPKVETHEGVSEEIKETVEELFGLMESEAETPPKPTEFEEMVTAKMEEFYEEKKKVAEAEEIRLPPYVFIVAIGNIGKLKEILSGDEVPGYVHRWSFAIVESGKKSQIFIQALHKEIPNDVLSESLSLGDGVLVVTPIKNIAALNSALDSLSRRMKKCKFVIIDSDSFPKGLKVPPNLKIIVKKIENSDELRELIKSEVFPLF